MESQQTTKQSVETMARARYLDTLHNFDSWHGSSYKAGHPSIPLVFFDSRQFLKQVANLHLC